MSEARHPMEWRRQRVQAEPTRTAGRVECPWLWPARSGTDEVTRVGGSAVARRMTILIVVLVLVVGACGGGDDTGDGMVGLLATLPDTADTRQEIILNDFAAVGELLGIDSPGRNATRDDLIEYFLALAMGDGAEPGSLDDLDTAERRARSTHVWSVPRGFNFEYLGFDEYLEEFIKG